jgi:hypothetical protein
MGKAKDITGHVFGRLTALYPHHQGDDGAWFWLCKCECGNEILCDLGRLNSGNTQSCGCYKRDRTSETFRTHGMTNTKLGKVFKGMKQRCSNPKHSSYKNYGGRGIRVCEEWLTDSSSFFEWAVDNGYVEGLVIDRIDNNGPYSPENCRWTTYTENGRNRRDTVFLTLDGKTQDIGTWGEKLGIKPKTIANRLRAGHTTEEALSTSFLKSGPRVGSPPICKSSATKIRLTHNGITKTIKEWSSFLGIGTSTIYFRISKGYPVEDVLSTVPLSCTEKSGHNFVNSVKIS